MLVATVVIFLAVVVVKPWDRGAATRPAGVVAPVSAGPFASPATATRSGPAPVDLTPAWPAAATPSGPDGGAASQAEAMLTTLARHAGTWGVGNAGVGPRLVRDEPWADWVAVQPEAAGDIPSGIAIEPGTSLCDGLPTTYDRPSVVAVTVPADLAADLRLAGWWTDGSNVAHPVGSIRLFSLEGERGIGYLERTDLGPWPPGRYEFQVIRGVRPVALTVCLTRRG